MNNHVIKMILFFMIFILNISLAAAAEKCALKGALIRWEYAYCLTLNETDDCENEAVSKCAGDLNDGFKTSKTTECENKKALQEKQCDLLSTNKESKESKEYKNCLKNIPTVVKKGC